jgi:hypothetical protein
VSAVSLSDGLRAWLGDVAAGSGRWLERDYLPDVPDVAWVRAVCAGADRSVGPAEFAEGLLAVARDGDPGMRAAVVDALGGAGVRWWLAVDEALRQRWWSAPVWSCRLAADLADGDGEPDVLRLVVAGCHHDGRIREAAVVRLAGRRHPAAVAVVALRACDWVGQVRQQARRVVAQWSLPLGDAALTTLVELASALGGRREGGWLAQWVTGMLQGLPAHQLAPLLAARDRRARRAAYRAAITTGWLSLDRLTTAAVRDGDLPIRTMCARAAVATATSAEQLRGLLASRTALVRAEALQAVALSGDLGAAEAALPDRHPLVRAVAQDALRRAGTDLVGYYRRLAAGPAPPPGVIAGLGETGDAGDADTVARWLSHPRARVRVEAIRAMRRLGVTRPADVVPMLRDESPAVTRQAVITLRREISAVDRHVLEALLRPGTSPHVRFAGYRLLTAGDAWRRLATNLRLIDDPDERLRVNSRADIAAWLDRDAATTYRAPSPDRAAELDRLIDCGRPILGDHKVRLLRFHVGLAPSG